LLSYKPNLVRDGSSAAASEISTASDPLDTSATTTQAGATGASVSEVLSQLESTGLDSDEESHQQLLLPRIDETEPRASKKKKKRFLKNRSPAAANDDDGNLAPVPEALKSLSVPKTKLLTVGFVGWYFFETKYVSSYMYMSLGHPNAGKSSLINALMGRPTVRLCSIL
jgi:hypothetical protein